MALVTYQDARPWARAIRTRGGQSRDAAVVRRSEVQPRAGEQPQPDRRGDRHHRRVGGCGRRRKGPARRRRRRSSPKGGTTSRTVRPTSSSRCRPTSKCRRRARCRSSRSGRRIHLRKISSSRRSSCARAPIGAVHHSDVTARALPAGTTLGRGRAWKDGPLVDFVPVYPDGRSYNELTGEGATTGVVRDARRADGAADRGVPDQRRLPPAVLRAWRRISGVSARRGQAHQRRQCARLEPALHADGQAGEGPSPPRAVARAHAADARSGDQAHRRSAHHRGQGIRRRPRRRGLSDHPRICRTTGGSPRLRRSRRT